MLLKFVDTLLTIWLTYWLEGSWVGRLNKVSADFTRSPLTHAIHYERWRGFINNYTHVVDNNKVFRVYLSNYGFSHSFYGDRLYERPRKVLNQNEMSEFDFWH